MRCAYNYIVCIDRTMYYFFILKSEIIIGVYGMFESEIQRHRNDQQQSEKNNAF